MGSTSFRAMGFVVAIACLLWALGVAGWYFQKQSALAAGGAQIERSLGLGGGKPSFAPEYEAYRRQWIYTASVAGVAGVAILGGLWLTHERPPAKWRASGIGVGGES